MGRQSGGAPFPPSGPAPRRHFAAGRRARNRLISRADPMGPGACADAMGIFSMTSVLSLLGLGAEWAFYATLLIALVALAWFVWVSAMVRYIPNDRLGVLEKLWSLRGSVSGGLIALKGEAGFQPEVMRGGFHFFMPFQYRIHRAPIVTIPQGQIGYVFARDGVPLASTQTLASNVEAADFSNARAFLEQGGHKGPQRKILREGAYAFNLAQFVILTKESNFAVALNADDAQLFATMSSLIESRAGFEPVVIKDADDVIGIVTVHDGRARFGAKFGIWRSIEAFQSVALAKFGFQPGGPGLSLGRAPWAARDEGPRAGGPGRRV